MHLLFPIAIQDAQVLPVNLTKIPYPLSKHDLEWALMQAWYQQECASVKIASVFPSKFNTRATQEKVTWKETFCSLLLLLLYNEVALSTGNKSSKMKVSLKLHISLPNFM